MTSQPSLFDIASRIPRGRSPASSTSSGTKTRMCERSRMSGLLDVDGVEVAVEDVVHVRAEHVPRVDLGQGPVRVRVAVVDHAGVRGADTDTGRVGVHRPSEV